MKPYPCSLDTHAAIMAGLALLDQDGPAAWIA